MKKILRALGFIALLSTGSANAALILNISDDGGLARFTFSGSDVFLSDGNVNNGIWFSDSVTPGLFDLTTYAARTSSANVTGTASATIAGNTNAFVDTWWNGTESFNTFGIRFGGNINMNATAGEAISWTGTVLSQLSFDHFNLGSFAASEIGPRELELAAPTDGMTINVDPTTQVPAPAPLALLGLGLMYLSLNRKKR